MEHEVTLLEIKILGFRCSLVCHLCKLPLQSINRNTVSTADGDLRASLLTEVDTEILTHLPHLRDLVPFKMP